MRAGLRSLAAGLGDDGDPAGWTVDRATAAAVAPALGGAVAAQPDVLAGPLVRRPAGAAEDRRCCGGWATWAPTRDAAAGSWTRAVAEAVARLDAAAGAGAADRAVAVAAGFRRPSAEYGQRLAYALDGFAAQERAGQRKHVGLDAG